MKYIYILLLGLSRPSWVSFVAHLLAVARYSCEKVRASREQHQNAVLSIAEAPPKFVHAMTIKIYSTMLRYNLEVY